MEKSSRAESRLSERSQKRREDSGFTLIELIVVVIIIAILATVGVVAFSSSPSFESGDYNIQGAQGEVTRPAEPVSFAPVIYGLGGILGLAGIGGGAFAATKAVGTIKRSRKENQAKLTEAKAVREGTKNRHREVLVRYSDYETDLWKALNYPALHDVEVAETSEFLKAMRDAEAKEKALEDDKEMLSAYLYDKYENAVSHLEHTFTLAENKAIRLGESSLSSEEQKDIKNARMLLSHAEDSGNNEEMRANYYEQLKRVIVRLNEQHRTPIIPQPALLEIENQSRLLLPEGTGSADSLDIMVNDNSSIMREDFRMS